LLGHDGKDVVVEHLDESQHDNASDPRVAERQDVRTQREHGPDFLCGQFISDRHRVRSEEAVLESCGVIGCQTHVRQAPETGRHSVDDRPSLDGVSDHLPSSLDPLEDFVTERRAAAARDPYDVLDPERPAQFHRCGRDHQPSIASDEVYGSQDPLPDLAIDDRYAPEGGGP